MINRVLYNPLSGKSNGRERAEKIRGYYPEETVFCDVTVAEDINELIKNSGDDDRIIICGGDGTLNHFVNSIEDTVLDVLKGRLFYYPTGSGNDFYLDVTGSKNGGPISLYEYIRDLPTVCVKEEKKRFINGVGYGLDGFACAEVERIRRATGKIVKYTNVAIHGLLYRFKPQDAVITVDGIRHEYKNVWLIPSMKGKYFGGGVMITPGQDRNDPEKRVSVLVWHAGRIFTLIHFAESFKGGHVKHENAVDILRGKDIKVEFGTKTDMQIDGEPRMDISIYEVHA